MNDSASQPNDRPSIEDLAAPIIASYDTDPRTRHIDLGDLPSRAATIDLLEMIRDLFFPGYYTPKALMADGVRDHVARRVADIRESLEQQIAIANAYRRQMRAVFGDRPGVTADTPGATGATTTPDDDAPAAAEVDPRATADEFLRRVPAMRAMLSLDVQAAFDGDPAAVNTDETIFCYPGIDAVFTYRVAHELYTMGVPMLPRIMSEYAHNETGIDIHPGATIGKSFFIDHGTGVVVGQTCVIGDRCKLYQGVTLGAMSFPKDSEGNLIRGTRRHPTLEDDVTIYANATILGGNTIIGRGCIIGGAVFLTKSVPPGHYVTLKSQELRYRSAEVHDRLVAQRKDDEE
ncbi:MAG: serine acetyltransferase [Phycisphaera sp.]|nr:serine acetyltransferase [Phycisphaera sp.]